MSVPLYLAAAFLVAVYVLHLWWELIALWVEPYDTDWPI